MLSKMPCQEQNTGFSEGVTTITASKSSASIRRLVTLRGENLSERYSLHKYDHGVAFKAEFGTDRGEAFFKNFGHGRLLETR